MKRSSPHFEVKRLKNHATVFSPEALKLQD